METERLILDSIKESDKEDYFINISHNKEVLKTFICRYSETLEDFDFSAYPGRTDLFAIRIKETGRLIGIVCFFDETADACEIGYGIGSAYWGCGYATEAVHRFVEYLFREKGLKKVYASFFTGNDASRRVMEKCGMHYSHFAEKELTYLDVPRDLTYYVIEDLRQSTIPRRGIQGRERGKDGMEDGKRQGCRHGAREAPNAAGGTGRKMELPGKLYPNHGR